MDDATFQRLQDEHAQLTHRLEKLRAFIRTDTFDTLPRDDREDLRAQFAYMCDYQNVLRRRIKRQEDYRVAP